MANLSDFCKQFLQRPNIAEAINNYRFDYIYKEFSADPAISIYKGTTQFIGEITSMFYELGVDVASYLTNLPDYFAYKSTYNFGDYVIPDNVNYIGENSFNSCRNLTKITIPDNLTFLGVRAFNQCSRLSEINFGKGLKAIDSFCFYGCNNLTKVEVPGTLDILPSQCFMDCANLQEVVLGEGLQHIYYEAFSGCSNLKKLCLPSTITKIFTNVFAKCNSLNQLDYNGTKNQFNKIWFYADTDRTDLLKNSNLNTVKCLDGVINLRR